MTAEWPVPCLNEFDRLASSDPERLLCWIEAGVMTVGHLTLAAEASGNGQHPRTEAVLVRLLNHDHAMVREGALLGLQHLPALNAVTLEEIRRVAGMDASPGVRYVAKEVLDLLQS